MTSIAKWESSQRERELASLKFADEYTKSSGSGDRLAAASGATRRSALSAPRFRAPMRSPMAEPLLPANGALVEPNLEPWCGCFWTLVNH